MEFNERPGEEIPCIYAETAGISALDDAEKAQIMAIVDRILPPTTKLRSMANLAKHAIDVQGTTPVKHQMTSMSDKMLEVAYEEVPKVAELGIIKRSASDWSSTTVIVRKSDGR